MTRMHWLGTFAALVITSFRYRVRRLEALAVGTMLDPLHFTTIEQRIERGQFRIMHKARTWAADFEHVVGEARRYFAARLRAEASA